MLSNFPLIIVFVYISNKGLELLKASLQSKNALTDVFMTANVKIALGS